MKRVKRPHGLLPKRPQKGDPITVVDIVFGDVKQATVRKTSGGRSMEYNWFRRFEQRNGSIKRLRVGGSSRLNQEGITWARGWDTPEADALRVAAALMPRDRT